MQILPRMKNVEKMRRFIVQLNLILIFKDLKKNPWLNNMCKLAVHLDLCLWDIMFKNVWFTLILHTFLSLCGHTYGFLLSSVHLTILFRQVFFLHSALQTHQGESSFLGNQQLVALPLSCYEQLCSSCKKEAAGDGWMKRACWVFKRRALVWWCIWSLLLLRPWIPFIPHGFWICMFWPDISLPSSCFSGL